MPSSRHGGGQCIVHKERGNLNQRRPHPQGQEAGEPWGQEPVECHTASLGKSLLLLFSQRSREQDHQLRGRMGNEEQGLRVADKV